MWDRFEVVGTNPITVRGWRSTAEGAGELAGHYLGAGWVTVTITDTESERIKLEAQKNVR